MRTLIAVVLMLSLAACVPIGVKTTSLPLAGAHTAARA